MSLREKEGIIFLEDLPNKEIFICLKKDFFNELSIKIRTFGIFKFAREINVSNRILCHWITESSLIRLDVLLKILNYFNYLNWKDKISFLRGKDGNKLYNPKLPFDFRNPSGVKLISSILGDGGLSNKEDIIYSNTNPILIKDFIKDSKNVFGDIEFYICKSNKKNSIIEVIYLPSFLRHVFYLLGFEKGKKVVNNPLIPSFIYKLSDKNIFNFISKMIDDEGSVNIKSKHISISSAVEDNHINSNILLGIKDLLLKLNIHSEIYIGNTYSSTRGRNRLNMKLEIHNYDQLKILFENLNIRSRNKSKKLKILLNSYSQMHYSMKRCKEIYLFKMEQIEKEKGFFTASDLSILLNRKVGHIRNMLLKYNKENIINKTEGVKSDGLTFYPARYIIRK